MAQTPHLPIEGIYYLLVKSLNPIQLCTFLKLNNNNSDWEANFIYLMTNCKYSFSVLYIHARFRIFFTETFLIIYSLTCRILKLTIHIDINEMDFVNMTGRYYDGIN
jgi:hypothetical protein